MNTIHSIITESASVTFEVKTVNRLQPNHIIVMKWFRAETLGM